MALMMKLTGLNGLIELTNRERWTIVDYLKDVSSDRLRPLDGYIDDEVFKSIRTKEDVFAKNKDIGILKGYYLTHAAGEFQYQLTLITTKSAPATAKRMFKDLLLTPSALDGLRGESNRRREDTFYYDLIVDCNDKGNPAKGIHRLARAVWLLEKHLNKG